MMSDDRSLADIQAHNDQLIADFWKSCDEFIASFDRMKEREAAAHDELMRTFPSRAVTVARGTTLLAELDDHFHHNRYDMDAAEIATTNEPTEGDDDD